MAQEAQQSATGLEDGVDIEKLTTGEPIAVFFSSDPHVDTLMRSRLINGFTVRVGGRVAEGQMFSYMDFVLRQLLNETTKLSEAADTHLLEIARGSSQSQEMLIEAVQEYNREVDMFKRNRIQHPHNLFRDFEEDPVSQTMIHTSKNAVSVSVQDLAHLDMLLDEWEDGTMQERLGELFLHSPTYAVLLLGGWTPEGSPQGLVMVVCQLTAKATTLLDKYLHPADNTLKLVHLGPEGNIERDEAFFEDLSLLENTPTRDYKAAGCPTVSKLRLWQSSPRGAIHGGAVVALQAWYGGKHGLTSGMRGSRSSAQFFVDILFDNGEKIREISGYLHHGEYGYLQIETNKGATHSVGLRQAGYYFKVHIPGNDGFEAVAFAGETAPTGELKTLKLLMCTKEHFYVPPDTLEATQQGEPEEAGLAAQASRRRVLPEPHPAARTSPAARQAGGGGEAAASHRTAFAGSREGGPRQRPVSSLGRHSRPQWEGDKEDGAAVRVRPHSAMQRLGRDHAPPLSRPASASPLPAPAASASKTAVEGRELLDDTPGAALAGWRRRVAEAVREGSVTAQTRLILQVEYCTAERPSNSLRGSAQQYVQAVADLRERCKSVLWEYNLRVLGNTKFERWGSERDLVTSPLKPRIGACEVTLSWQHRLTPFSVLVHSKLARGKWPHAEALCEELRELLPAQYHDIRFMADSAADTIAPHHVRVTITRTEGADPLGVMGAQSVAYTDEDGVAAVSLPAGRYHVTMEHELLETASMDYAVEDPAHGHYRPFQRLVMHPKLQPDQVAVSLSWSLQPADLDLYVVTPTGKVSHQHKSNPLTRSHIDIDVRTGYGPETVTLYRPSGEELEALERRGAGTSCHVFVHQYSEDGDLAESEAELRLQTGVGLNHVVGVPLEGVGQFWDAFSLDLKTMALEERHVITAQEPSFDVLLQGKKLVKSDGAELGRASDASKDRGVAMLGAISAQRRKSSRLLHDYQHYSGVR